MLQSVGLISGSLSTHAFALGKGKSNSPSKAAELLQTPGAFAVFTPIVSITFFPRL
jgi:hypothetical protein